MALGFGGTGHLPVFVPPKTAHSRRIEFDGQEWLPPLGPDLAQEGLAHGPNFRPRTRLRPGRGSAACAGRPRAYWVVVVVCSAQ